jgi:hypothetical protein
MSMRTDFPEHIKKFRRTCASVTHISRILSGLQLAIKKAFRLATTNTLLPSTCRAVREAYSNSTIEIRGAAVCISLHFCNLFGFGLRLDGRSCRIRPTNSRAAKAATIQMRMESMTKREA